MKLKVLAQEIYKRGFFNKSRFYYKKILQTRLEVLNLFFSIVQNKCKTFIFRNLFILFLSNEVLSKNLINFSTLKNDISIFIHIDSLMSQTTNRCNWILPSFKQDVIFAFSRENFTLKNETCELTNSNLVKFIYRREKKHKLEKGTNNKKSNYLLMVSKKITFKNESKTKKTIFWGTLDGKNKKIRDDLVFMPFISFDSSEIFKPIFFSFLSNSNFLSKDRTFFYNSLGLFKISKTKSQKNLHYKLYRKKNKEHRVFSLLTYTNLDLVPLMMEFDEILSGLVGNLNNYNINLLNKLFSRKQTEMSGDSKDLIICSQYLLKFGSREQELLKLGNVELKIKKGKLLIKYSVNMKKRIFPIKIEKLSGTQMFFRDNENLSFLGKSKVNLTLKDEIFFLKKISKISYQNRNTKNKELLPLDKNFSIFPIM